jgi:ankyrin repeat protein
MRGVCKGHGRVVKALLKHKNVNVRKRDNNDRTAFDLANEYGHLDIASTLGIRASIYLPKR